MVRDLYDVRFSHKKITLEIQDHDKIATEKKVNKVVIGALYRMNR